MPRKKSTNPSRPSMSVGDILKVLGSDWQYKHNKTNRWFEREVVTTERISRRAALDLVTQSLTEGKSKKYQEFYPKKTKKGKLPPSVQEDGGWISQETQTRENTLEFFDELSKRAKRVKNPQKYLIMGVIAGRDVPYHDSLAQVAMSTEALDEAIEDEELMPRIGATSPVLSYETKIFAEKLEYLEGTFITITNYWVKYREA